MSLTPAQRLSLIQGINAELELLDEYDRKDALVALAAFGVEVPSGWGWEDPLDPRTWAVTHASDEQLLGLNEYFGGETLDRAVSIEAQRRIWGDGFRLFLSHTATHAKYVAEVKEGLAKLGISAFVAHADITPPRPWEDEILAALNSCDALAAFLHDNFHDSEWTDQEVGHALGRGVAVVPVMLGSKDPYGFMAKIQGIRASVDKNVWDLAVSILDTLVDFDVTQPLLAPHLVTRFELVPSQNHGLSFLKRLDRMAVLPSELLERIDTATKTNQHLDSDRVRDHVAAILSRHRYQPSLSGTADFGEEPF